MAYHTEVYKGHVIAIEQDEDAENPRQAFDNLGTIALANVPRWLIDLSDKNAITLPEPRYWQPTRRKGLGDFQLRYLRLFCDVAVALPVRYEDHGSNGSRFSTWEGMEDPDGFIYVTNATLRKEYGEDPQAKEHALSCLKSEVDELNAWCAGEVFGYIVRETDDEEDETADEVDSCWGFYGFDFAVAEARSAVDSHVEHTEHQVSLANT